MMHEQRRFFYKTDSLWIMSKFAGEEKNTSRAETTGCRTSAVAESGQAQVGTEEGHWGSAHHGPRPGRWRGRPAGGDAGPGGG